MSAIVSPDCRDQNHQKCPGDAWDEAHDHVSLCQCSCHAEQELGSVDLLIKPIHYVKIVEGKVKFECQDATAKCHTYPACDCEMWGNGHAAEEPGHEKIHHAECWMQGWFDYGGAVYVGDDAADGADNRIPEGMNREGFITTEWEDEWIEFEFAKDTTPTGLADGFLGVDMTGLLPLHTCTRPGPSYPLGVIWQCLECKETYRMESVRDRGVSQNEWTRFEMTP